MHSPAAQFVLSNGVSVPAVGFGTYKTGDDGGVLSAAIEQGYRHFDTASFYGTEAALGRAVAESRSLRAVGQQLQEIYRQERLLEPARRWLGLPLPKKALSTAGEGGTVHSGARRLP